MMKDNFAPTLAVWLMGMASAVSYGASYYASPSGSTSGTGTISNPWALTTALSHPSVVRPGDTIFLRGGTYRGSFMSKLAGTAAAPIQVRPYQNERVILDGASAPSATAPMYGALTITGPFTWYMGFEITNSYPTRVYQRNNCFEYQHCRGHGVDVFGQGVKLINLVIHDTSDAVGLWTPAIDAEVYGCIIYYVGNQTETRGHGMGIYAQNDVGTKRITNNIIFDGFHSGIHIYGSGSSSLRNVIVEGNTIFQNGILSADPNGWGIIVGGNVVADTITVRNNYLFNPNWFTRSSNMNPSWGTYGSTRLTVTNNDSVGYRSIEYSTTPTSSTISGNRLYGTMNDLATLAVSLLTNTIGVTPPAAPRVYLRPNTYDNKLTYVTIFNGGSASTVSVNPSSVLTSGDTFEVVDTENYFGTPVLRGTYTGAALSFPMGSSTLSPIVGTPPRFPVSTGPTFGSFILKKTTITTTGGTTPPPVVTPPPTTGALCSVNAACQAESGVIASPMTRFSNAAGGYYLSSPTANSGAVTLTFDMPYASAAYVWMRMIAPNNLQDSFFISVDGGAEVEFLMSSGWSTSPTWALATQRNATTGATAQWSPQLGAGRHTIRIRAREANTGLDALAISNSSTYRP